MANKKLSPGKWGSVKSEAITLVVVLHPKKSTPKGLTRQQYLDRVTRVAMKTIKSELLVRSTVLVQS